MLYHLLEFCTENMQKPPNPSVTITMHTLKVQRKKVELPGEIRQSLSCAVTAKGMRQLMGLGQLLKDMYFPTV